MNLDQIGILNETTIEEIIMDYNATNCLCSLFHGNNTYYYFYVTSDQRMNHTMPPPLTGNMTGHIIVYTGSTWIDLGDGQLNLMGDVSSIGVVTTINDNVITNAMIKEPIQDYNLATIVTAGKVSNSATTASIPAVPYTILERDMNASVTVNGVFFNDSGSTPLSAYAEYTFTLDVANQTNGANNLTTVIAVRTGSTVCLSLNQINYTSSVNESITIGLGLSSSNFPPDIKSNPSRGTKYLTNVNVLVSQNLFSIGSVVFRSNIGIFTITRDGNNGFTQNLNYLILPFDFCYVLL